MSAIPKIIAALAVLGMSGFNIGVVSGQTARSTPEVRGLVNAVGSLRFVLDSIEQYQKPGVNIDVSVTAKEEGDTEPENTPDFHESHDTVITCTSKTDEGQQDCDNMGLQLTDQGYGCTSEIEGGVRCSSL
jgi:hypothetical protein